MARRLDAKLMAKLARKLDKRNLTAVNKVVSSYASRHRISSEAALVRLAQENGIGASIYLRSLDAHKQAEVRYVSAEPHPVARYSKGKAKDRNGASGVPSQKAALRGIVQYLIQDSELRDRCADLLLAPRNFDRPINQATLILEDRIRQKAQPTTQLSGSDLVGFAFNEELTRTTLEVATRNQGDQRGFTQILRGIVPTFRNPTHHHVINTFSREDAIRVCGFIDVLLRVVGSSTKVR